MDEADVGAAPCGEEAGEAEVDAGEDRVDDVAADVLHAQRDYRRIRSEQADDGAGSQFHDNGDDDAVCHGDRGGVCECLHGPVRFAGTDVLRGYGRDCGEHG